MKATQVSVFVENRPGRLAAVLKSLQARGISIKGLSVSDAAEIGIVRMILSDPEVGLDELRRTGFTVRADYVLCVVVPDVPGGLLQAVAGPMAAAGVNLQYFYVYTEPSTGSVIAVIKADDLDKAEVALGGS